MDHLNNTYASSKLSVDFLSDLDAQLEHPEPFLCPNCEIWLVLIKTDMNDFLFLMIHPEVLAIIIIAAYNHTSYFYIYAGLINLTNK